MKILKTVALATTIITSLATFASANDAKVVWGGGKPENSTYSRLYVPAVVNGLAANRLSGYKWGGVSQGTLDNYEKVVSNPTNLAVGQMDMLRGLPGITILHENVGPECLYMVTKEKGYENLGHVFGNAWDLQVITGGEKSGSFGTWKVLASTYPDLGDMPVINAGGAGKIIEQVKNATDPSIGFFVMRPDPKSATFTTIAEAGLNFIPVVDLELEENYDFFSLKVAKSGLLGLGKGNFVETACTSVALFTGTVTDEIQGRDRKRLEATIKRVTTQTSPEDFTPKTSDFSDMFNSMKGLAGNRLAELAKAAKETASNLAEKATQN